MRLLPLLVIAALGCSGVIGDPSHLEDGDPVLRPGEIPEFEAAPASLRRLTQTQYRKIVRRVFGDVTLTRELEPDESSVEFSTHGAAQVTTSSHGVEQYRNAAMELADQIWERRSEYPQLAACAPSSSTDPCISEALRAFARGLFRREPTNDEVDRLAAIVGAAGSEESDVLDMGMRYAIAALLQSPSFLYVPSIGERHDGKQRYTGEEMASRLSLLLWNEGPDEELIEEADSLTRVAGIERQTRRMLADERARDFGTRFLAESWHFATLEETDKRADRFPEWTADLLADFRTEAELVIEALTFDRDDDLFAIFDGTTTQVNQRLADFYGIDGSFEGFEEVALDETRTGLLTSGIVIAASSPSDRSTPTERGVFVLQRLRCQDLPSPPPSALEQAIEELAEIEPGNEREFIERRLADPECGGCHQTIDPLGMVFDDYDAIGRFRTGEGAIGALGSEPYESVHELAADLREDPAVRDCMARRFYSYAVGHAPTLGETRSVVDASSSFGESGNRFRELVVAVVTSDGFRFIGEE